jgi:hypothetical protein
MPRNKSKEICIKCGRAIAAGLLVCATCANADTTSRIQPGYDGHQAEVTVVKISPERPILNFYTIEELKAMGQIPVDHPDDRDMPEGDYTFYTPEVATVGTASTTGLRRPSQPWWYPHHYSD